MKQLILTLAIFSSLLSYSQSSIQLGEEAPNINITHWIKNVPEDKDLSNKFIVLEFWATWCGPCIAAVPHMNELQEEFDNDDLYFISITDESVEKVKRSLKRIDFKSIVATDNSGSLEKLEQEILNTLDLTKQIKEIPAVANMVSVKDNSLLEETLEKEFSAKSDADDKIIFTAYTIEDMLEEISLRATQRYLFSGKNNKKYDFIIDIDSKKQMTESLQSYGFEVVPKEISVNQIEINVR